MSTPESTLTHYHGQPYARVDLNPMPESTLVLCQSRLYPPRTQNFASVERIVSWGNINRQPCGKLHYVCVLWLCTLAYAHRGVCVWNVRGADSVHNEQSSVIASSQLSLLQMAARPHHFEHASFASGLKVHSLLKGTVSWEILNNFDKTLRK
jgi:hypothetical protein